MNPITVISTFTLKISSVTLTATGNITTNGFTRMLDTVIDKININGNVKENNLNSEINIINEEVKVEENKIINEEQKITYVVESKDYPLIDNKVKEDLLHDWELSKSKNISFELEGKTAVYEINFLKEQKDKPAIQVLRGSIPDILRGRSYPTCSCPSFFYRTNKCKHIERLFIATGLPINDINWSIGNN